MSRSLAAGIAVLVASLTGAMVGGQSFGGWKFSATTDRGAGGPWYLTQFLREQSRTYADGTSPPS